MKLFPAIGLLAIASQSAVLFTSASGEDLDLTQAKGFDWADKANGGETRSHALLAPTQDSVELVRMLKKIHGIRLTTLDAVHTAVVSAGPTPSDARFRITRGLIDRFRRLIHLDATLTVPSRKKTKPKAESEGAIEELVIRAARPAAGAPVKPVDPSVQTSRDGSNPTLMLPVGRLEEGRWWIRVKMTWKKGANSVERAPMTASFVVQDHRPSKEKTHRREPEVGLQKPDSPSVLDGMGGGP